MTGALLLRINETNVRVEWPKTNKEETIAKSFKKLVKGKLISKGKLF